jgi:threonine dehydratase
VAAICGEQGANIVEVGHQRLFSDLSVKRTGLDLAVETRDRDHADRLVAALEAAGFRVNRAEAL